MPHDHKDQEKQRAEFGFTPPKRRSGIKIRQRLMEREVVPNTGGFGFSEIKRQEAFKERRNKLRKKLAEPGAIKRFKGLVAHPGEM